MLPKREETIKALVETRKDGEGMPNALVSIIGSAFSDMLTYFQFGGVSVTSTVAQTAIASYLQRRLEESRDMLLEELRQGNIDRIEFDSEYELGGVLFRYFNAVRDNAARLNLRLMAKAMVGQARNDQIYADEFTRYANILSAMTRDEVIASITVYKYTLDIERTPVTSFSDPRTQKMVDDVVPSLFADVDYFISVCGALTRFGLVINSNDGNSFRFVSTSIMANLTKLIDFQDALRKEGIVMPQAG